MPKKVKQSSSIINSDVRKSQHIVQEYSSLIPKKTRNIKKLVHNSSKNKEESKQQLTEVLTDLLSLINKQFDNSTSLFRKKTTKPTKTLLPPQVTKISHRIEFEITILPTIKECSKIAQQDEEHIKKEKEQTQISSVGQKVW